MRDSSVFIGMLFYALWTSVWTVVFYAEAAVMSSPLTATGAAFIFIMATFLSLVGLFFAWVMAAVYDHSRTAKEEKKAKTEESFPREGVSA